ncbi:hypothetical protein GS501_04600 [Saccharibacter sp. 17.LH.SD]|uniref:DUF3383 domain-containing protein n=1 Tax=Saccharibacter sp. 17.LH.SD TaxID=2689393 RepID=UPI00136E2F53|nr:DUF3383 domain-containing protein [Saccharibacter sp. 17.LH.SD]MXV44325.1 hypothetical protein [Saccharibacter sp. 17.LH.SD]
MPQIVTINESVTRGAMPNLLQQKACLISLGATSIPVGQAAEVTSLSDVMALLSPLATVNIKGGSENGQPIAHGTIDPTDGTPEVDDMIRSTSGNKAAMAELQAMAQSWFANTRAGFWILELGPISTTAIEAPLSAFIATYPQSFYAYVLPRGATHDANLPAFFANQSNSDARGYFFLCGDADSYKLLLVNGQGQKSVFYGAEYVGSAVTNGTSAATLTQEHLASAVAAQFCSARPSGLNRLAPMNFRQLVGITPWPEAGHSTVFAEMKRNNVGFAGTASEGGIAGSILFWGTLLNGDTLTGWYGADWCSITLERQLANVLIEGSQPGQRPLIYNQEGISRLTARAQQTLDGAVISGCILAQYTLTATDFGTYIAANPSDYTTGTYNGLAATIVPIRGFTSLTFNLAIDFSGQSVTTAATVTGA